MLERPIILIGETHPSGIEQELEQAGELKTRIKEVRGIKRLVVDRSDGPERSKKSLRRILESIIKKEALILKKEKIRRLFCEEHASAEGKRLYAEFRKTHDLKRLRDGLSGEYCRTNPRAMQDIDRLLVEIGLWQPLLGGFRDIVSMNEFTQSVFALSQVSVAKRAGIFEIFPFDDEQLYREATRLVNYWGILMQVPGWLASSPDAAEYRKKYGRELFVKARAEMYRIGQIIETMQDRVHGDREFAACGNIMENYVPGSAVICGLLHVDSLGKLLAKRFRVKVYRVGRELVGAE